MQKKTMKGKCVQSTTVADPAVRRTGDRRPLTKLFFIFSQQERKSKRGCTPSKISVLTMTAAPSLVFWIRPCVIAVDNDVVDFDRLIL